MATRPLQASNRTKTHTEKANGSNQHGIYKKSLNSSNL